MFTLENEEYELTRSMRRVTPVSNSDTWQVVSESKVRLG